MDRSLLCLGLFLAFAALALSQPPCYSELNDYTQCVTKNIMNHNCVPGQWCDACAGQFGVYANCTCEQSIGKTFPKCVPQCAAYATCSAEAAMDHNKDCSSAYAALQACITGGTGKMEELY